MALWRRGCPRCGGDLFEERHLESVDMVCLQCGHILTGEQETIMRGNSVATVARTIRGKGSERVAVAA